MQTALAKVGHAIAVHFKPEDTEKAYRKLVELMDCQRTVRGERNPAGGYHYVQEPDSAVQLVATVKYLEWAIGKPTATVVNVDGNQPGPEMRPDEFMAKLMSDPEALKAAEDVFLKLKKAIPVDITPPPSLPEGQNPSA
jgi:hypothetical protein